MEWWWMESPNFRPEIYFSGLKFPGKSLVLLVRRRIPKKFQALKSKFQALKSKFQA